MNREHGLDPPPPFCKPTQPEDYSSHHCSVPTSPQAPKPSPRQTGHWVMFRSALV